ncbi:MAG: hypothetical protein GQ535_05210 [Rhodobacteraceae bacterium]|nr:hypothetical protein [Paracoccaceae bacterium]
MKLPIKILSLALLIPAGVFAENHGAHPALLPSSWVEINEMLQKAHISGYNKGIKATCNKFGLKLSDNNGLAVCSGTPYPTSHQAFGSLATSTYYEVDTFDFSQIGIPNTTSLIALGIESGNAGDLSGVIYPANTLDAAIPTAVSPYFIGIYPQGLNMQERGEFIGSFGANLGE